MMWSIRMRASQSLHLNKLKKEIHISGAERLCKISEVSMISKTFINRALEHPRGVPDKIVITIERLEDQIFKKPVLEIKTLSCQTPQRAKDIILKKLKSIDISSKALVASFKIILSQKTMRGASLITQLSGIRKEEDKERGIRVSRFGFDKKTELILSNKLAIKKLNHTIVKEALALASKVASYSDIVAEICISDNPDYTTGYIASRQFGYLRIPNIKNIGSKYGGRVFFIKENANVKKLVEYLEKQPVILNSEKL